MFAKKFTLKRDFCSKLLIKLEHLTLALCSLKGRTSHLLLKALQLIALIETSTESWLERKEDKDPKR
ncbi:CLUMA_CG011811, isoform A [Clunio marinus]|uniref:CLUMA_CG011811, isoform A n=1 Tax=Clunio marinus TaxID=568069 RepID=A0A1J1IHE5_9DIPT|nr:CLUMA_CG011811, isoform A [Clunio marinus]